MATPALTYNPLSWNQGTDLTKSEQAKTFVNQLSNYLSGLQKQVYTAPGIFVTPAFINIADYGADPTGATDSTSAIQSALNANTSSGTVYFPAGTYSVNATLTISHPGIYIGAGPQATAISTASASNDVVVVNASGVTIENMEFTSSVTRTANWYVVLNPGFGYFFLDNFIMVGHVGGILVQNCLTGSINNAYMVAAANANSNHIDLTGTTTDFWVNRITADTTGASQIGAGIAITGNNGGCFISNCDILHAGNGLILNNNVASSNLLATFVMNCYFDTCNTGCALQTTASGALLVNARFTNCWFSSNNVDGVVITTTAGSVKGIQFCNCEMSGNTSRGLLINTTSASDIRLDACGIGGNLSDGFFSNISNYSITNSRIGSYGLFSGNGGWGINGVASQSGVVITGNDLRGNTSGEINTGISFSTSVVTNNI